MDTERKLGCPHCKKLLPDYAAEEILDDDPLRCSACRRIVDLPPWYVEKVRQSPDGQAYLARRKKA